MAEFDRTKIDQFLGTVRKYMQVRGPMSQKELALLTDSGISSMSRFLTRKTNDINAQLIAKIVAKLDIPLHEIIDFVEEDYADEFIRLVKFFKGEEGSPPQSGDPVSEANKKAEATLNIGGRETKMPFGEGKNLSIKDKLELLTPRQKAYLTDFLNLDVEAKDLMVDLGNSLFRYFRQKGMEFFD